MLKFKAFLATFVVTFGLGLWLFFGPEFESQKSSAFDDLIQDLIHAPEIEIREESSKTEANCLHYNCFDIYKCGGSHQKILVHISKPVKNVINGREVSPMSAEFVEILEAITNSRFYTSNPDEACIFVPPFNMLNEAQLDAKEASSALNNFQHWNKAGKNNLLFNFFSGNFDSLKSNHGSAMVAGAGLSTFSYRNKFDISLPFVTHLHRQKAKISTKKKFNLVITQNIRSEVHEKLKPLASELTKRQDFVKYFPDLEGNFHLFLRLELATNVI